MTILCRKSNLVVLPALLIAVSGFMPAQTNKASGAGEVTFTKDIAPVLERSCQSCHRPGSIAPMSLLTYEDARPWARSIKQNVSQRQMPPWFIDRNVGIHDFKNDISLSEAEIATVVNWVDGGAPKGNPADMPAPMVFEDKVPWHIGKPDMIVSLPKDQIVAEKAP